MEAEDQTMQETAQMGTGFAAVGLILGCCGLVVSVVAVVFCAIAWAKGRKKS